MCENKIKQIWIIRENLQTEATFIYILFLAVLGLSCSMWYFFASQGLLSSCDMGLQSMWPQ